MKISSSKKKNIVLIFTMLPISSFFIAGGLREFSIRDIIRSREILMRNEWNNDRRIVESEKHFVIFIWFSLRACHRGRERDEEEEKSNQRWKKFHDEHSSQDDNVDCTQRSCRTFFFKFIKYVKFWRNLIPSGKISKNLLKSSWHIRFYLLLAFSKFSFPFFFAPLMSSLEGDFE